MGVLDGVGLSMFLPLLQTVTESGNVNPENLGALRVVIDFITGLGLSLTLSTILFFLLFFFLLKGVARFFAGAYMVIVQQFFITKIRIDLLDSLNKISFKEFVKSDVGRIQNTFTLEVGRVYRGFRNYFSALEQAVLVVVYTLFAFLVDVQFALFVTVGGVITNVVYQFIYKLTRKASQNFTTGSHKYQGQIIQHITNFKYLKATAFLQKYAEKLKKTIRDVERSNRRIGMLNALVMAVREPLLIAVVVAVILLQVQYLNNPIAPILVSLLFFYRALGALMNVQNSWNNFLGVSGSVDNVLAFQRELDKKREEIGGLKPAPFKDKIELRDVSFSYDDETVFENINLTICKNEFILIKGESGSGKTTLVNIITGLLPVDKGAVLIDGVESEKISINELQKQIGYITQEPVIFNDSVFNNVTLWDDKTDTKIDKFTQALKAANAIEFVESFSKKEDSILSNNGTNLSGGQRQRLSIAREIYKDPSILIIDEGTSALDDKNKSIIRDFYKSVFSKFTVLLISHDDSLHIPSSLLCEIKGKSLKINQFQNEGI